MTSRNLPDFMRPPVNEVVCGIQFEPLGGYRAAHHGKFWHRIADRYPLTEEHPPVSHLVEKPELALATRTEIQAVVEALPLVPRCWFLNQDKLHLIQVQADRFLRNWRQIEGDEAYPRFDELFPKFLTEWQEFLSFLGDEGIGQPVIDQCELTYINHIPQGDAWSHLGEASKVFRLFQKRQPSAFLPAPDTMAWRSSVPLPNKNGRLHIHVKHGVRSRDRVPILVLDLTARGPSTGQGIDEIKSWFNLAHDWIVRGFEDLTTPAMHSIWGKL